jgi:hypothetical protein
MSRSKLTVIEDDLINDGGNVLWSFVKGEQLEFPITLSFITDASLAYTFEAVVIEAANEVEQETKPLDIKTSGIQTPLSVVKPNTPTVYIPSNTYSYGDIVLYNSKYYKCVVINTTDAATSNDFVEININDIYIRFPSDLGSTWAIQPKVGYSVYGFFELSVTEPANPSGYRRTWKPIRGMVEILFSPTDVVP